MGPGLRRDDGVRGGCWNSHSGTASPLFVGDQFQRRKKKGSAWGHPTRVPLRLEWLWEVRWVSPRAAGIKHQADCQSAYFLRPCALEGARPEAILLNSTRWSPGGLRQGHGIPARVIVPEEVWPGSRWRCATLALPAGLPPSRNPKDCRHSPPGFTVMNRTPMERGRTELEHYIPAVKE